jgi:DNA-binding XRE family transcriptional regulator
LYTGLKKIREQEGYTQEDMAILLGYKHKSGYNQLETGKRKIDLNQAKKIADFFNKTIEEIFFNH